MRSINSPSIHQCYILDWRKEREINVLRNCQILHCIYVMLWSIFNFFKLKLVQSEIFLKVIQVTEGWMQIEVTLNILYGALEGDISIMLNIPTVYCYISKICSIFYYQKLKRLYFFFRVFILIKSLFYWNGYSNNIPVVSWHFLTWLLFLNWW